MLLGSRKSYLLPVRLNITNFVTLYQSKNAQLFLILIFCEHNPIKRDPILYQFSMIARPYTRLNGLKTIPFPAAHTHIAIWEYPPPPLGFSCSPFPCNISALCCQTQTISSSSPCCFADLLKRKTPCPIKHNTHLQPNQYDIIINYYCNTCYFCKT